MSVLPRHPALLALALAPACIFGGDDGSVDPTDGFETSDTDGTTAGGGSSGGVDGSGSTDGSAEASGVDSSDSAADSTTGEIPTLPSATAIAIANGRLHSCALTDAGVVRCWGYREQGQLGDGAPLDTTAVTVPVEVTAIDRPVTAISSFSDHTCALADDGGVWCWGDNGSGQLGDGTTTRTSTPVRVTGLQATAIAGGFEHNCAIDTEGHAQCWGKNDYGQLGNDSLDDSGTPVTVVGLQDVVSIAAGRYHSCAVTGDGAAWCWGGDTFGELGNDEATSASHVPVAVLGLESGIASITAGDSVGCAIGNDGGARCWGVNNDGQLGNGESGSFVESHTPVDVIGLDAGVTAIAPGFGYTCAVVDGAAQCWGDNGDGVLGNGEGDGFESATPVAVEGLGTGMAAIGTCTQHTCALTDAGAVWCWGNNDGGALGNGTQDSSDVPVAVLSLP